MKTYKAGVLGQAARRLTRGVAVTLAALGLTAIAALVSTQVVGGAASASADTQISPDRITLNHNQVLA